jgi:hypothetical protein
MAGWNTKAWVKALGAGCPDSVILSLRSVDAEAQFSLIQVQQSPGEGVRNGDPLRPEARCHGERNGTKSKELRRMRVCLEYRIPAIDEMDSCECRKLGQENADLRAEVERLKGLLSIKKTMMSNLKKELRYIRRSSQLDFTSETGQSVKVELSVLKGDFVQEKELLEEAHA